MRAIFRICGNESQPGLQLVEKLATLLVSISQVWWLILTVESTEHDKQNFDDLSVLQMITCIKTLADPREA